MSDHREFFQRLHRYLGMYVPDETFVAAVSFLSGYDYAHRNSPLEGFREWLVLRLGYGTNLAWGALVEELVHDRRVLRAWPGPWQEHQEKVEIDALFALLEEFLVLREQDPELREMRKAYDDLCRAQLEDL